MGREIRRVAKDWRHPKTAEGHYEPLLGRLFLDAWTEWEIGRRNWLKGRRESFSRELGEPWTEDDVSGTWNDWTGGEPEADSYMPPGAFGNWFMMYEDTTEGTPLHDVPFSSAEDLANHLFESGASFFGEMTVSREHWLGIARGGLGLPVFLVGSHAFLPCPSSPPSSSSSTDPRPKPSQR